MRTLGLQARIGRPVQDLPESFHEWVVDFGNSGYVVRYRIDGEATVVLTVWHQRESGF